MALADCPGSRLRDAVEDERPLQVVGTINALTAKLAEQTRFRAIYLSGAGVANASYGLPDLGMTSRENVLEDVRRITAATDLPLLVDVDTGWGDTSSIAKTASEMICAGAAGMQIEDQVSSKRCGHRPGKTLVSAVEMKARVKAASEARTEDDFVIMARTDAAANEGLPGAIDRAAAYAEAGADMIFAEALTDLDQFHQFTSVVSVPVLANLTEFGRTPLFTVDEMRSAGVRLVLYPLSAFRAMNAAARRVYQEVREQGTQQGVLDLMQTREELYEILDYHGHEQRIDKLLESEDEQ
ncbi:MAG: methylisocitrate lyase [Planctomycetaceae bacterium]|nr:methylisocitrate lyase [Planctomycetaceae bacterium]